jgi:hypothetical protein
LEIGSKQNKLTMDHSVAWNEVNSRCGYYLNQCRICEATGSERSVFVREFARAIGDISGVDKFVSARASQTLVEPLSSKQQVCVARDRKSVV